MGIQSISGFGGNRSIAPPIKLKSLEIFRNDLQNEWLKADKNIEELNDDWFMSVSAKGNTGFEDTKIIVFSDYADDDYDDEYLYSPAA